MAVKMERVNGNTAGVIPQFGLGVAYIHQTFRLSTLGGQKNAVSRSARPTKERFRVDVIEDTATATGTFLEPGGSRSAAAEVEVR